MALLDELAAARPRPRRDLLERPVGRARVLPRLDRVPPRAPRSDGMSAALGGGRRRAGRAGRRGRSVRDPARRRRRQLGPTATPGTHRVQPTGSFSSATPSARRSRSPSTGARSTRRRSRCVRASTPWRHVGAATADARRRRLELAAAGVVRAALPEAAVRPGARHASRSSSTRPASSSSTVGAGAAR